LIGSSGKQQGSLPPQAAEGFAAVGAVFKLPPGLMHAAHS
jgi:hypothetical protein